jgi:S-adenosylmethionine-dependent methyltransferase
VASERRGGGLEVPPGAGTPAGVGAASGARAAQRWHRYDDARTAVIREVLRAVVTGLVAETGRSRLDIVDAGGGTGGSAVPLAGQGHTVTVIDPSPDSLAAAQRRAAEMSVQLRAVQGDVGDLAAVVGEQGADLVLCHSVLEYVDSPAAAMTTVASVLRPGGAVSVLAASAVAAVIHRALAGRFDEARRLLAAAGGPAAAADGRAGAGPRRFTLAEVTGLIEEAGLRPGAAHGIRVFTDLVPGSFADVDPGAADALLALEQAASTHPAFHDFATQFHVLGYR